MSTLERAIALAAAAHGGQKDKAEAPYILHPLRVMQIVKECGGREVAQIAAVLHDVVEDSPVTPWNLRELGFSEEVIGTVLALTKRPEEHGAGHYFSSSGGPRSTRSRGWSRSPTSPTTWTSHGSASLTIRTESDSCATAVH